ncbi:MAG: exopolyphosphatase [Propionibacteriaceae bacterium]
MTVAAIDCGTNSIRLLIADPDGSGGLIERERRLEIVRLGQGIDATGQFHPDALRRTFEAVETYAAVIAAHDVGTADLHFVATSASRDARNRDEFFAGVQARLGVAPDVISGATEAQLSFVGALSQLPYGPQHYPDPILVVDVGGGSTELVVGRADGTIVHAVSLDMGSVRITERFLTQSPPGLHQITAAMQYVDGLLGSAGIDLGAVRTWVGVAGTATTLAAVHLNLTSYDRTQVHGAVIDTRSLHRLLDRLGALSAEQIRRFPSMHPGRADVITGGAVIADRIGRRVGTDQWLISESDILDGIALALLRAQEHRSGRLSA